MRKDEAKNFGLAAPAKRELEAEVATKPKLSYIQDRQTRNAINQPQSHPVPKSYIFKWDGTEAG